MKKILFSLLFGIFCMVGVQPVYAAGQLLAFLPEGQDCYYLNGTLVTTGEQQWHTFNYAGHTYFPIRTISELFGFQVQWQPDTQTIRLSDEKQVIVLKVDSHIAMVNQQEQAIDIAPIIQEGRSLIPLRTLAQLTDSYVLYKDGVIYYAETPISKAEQQQDWFRQIYTDLQANHSALSTEPYNIIYEDGEAIPLVSLYKDNQVEYLSQQFPYGIDKLFWRTNHQELHTVSIPNLTQVIGIWQVQVYYISKNESTNQYDLYRANLDGTAAQLLQASFCEEGLIVRDKRNRFYTEDGKEYLRIQKISTDWGSSSTVYLYQLTDKAVLPIARLVSEDRNTYAIVGEWCFSVEHDAGIDYLLAQQYNTESDKRIYLPFVEIISLQKEQRTIQVIGIVHDTEQITTRTYSCEELLALAQE